MIKRLIYISLFSAFIAAVQPARAFLCLGIDPCPMADPGDQVSSIVQNGGDLANNAQKFINTWQNNMNDVRSMLSSVMSGDLSTLVDVNSINPGQKAMEQCMYLGKIYKNTSADDVYDLVKILFLQYPDKGVVAEAKYDGYREEFYKDSMVEIYTAADQILADIDDRIRPSVEATISCVKGDSSACGIPSPDGNNDAVFVEGKAFEALDNIYTVLLKLTALRAQFVATKVISSSKPAPYVEGVASQTADTTDETTAASAAEAQTPAATPEPQTNAAVGALQKVYASASVHSSIPLAFAQLGLAQKSRTAVSALSKVESAAVIPNQAVREEVDNVFTFVTPPESPAAHAYVYEEDKMEELEKLEPLDEVVSKAREVHNTIHNLSSYKDAAESMEEMREKYQKALKSLKTADNCARTYIGRHFSNPAAVWGAKADITDYDGRSGISGWAFQAYETAKAAQTVETSTGDIIPANIDADEVDLSAPTDTEKNLALLKKKGSTSPGKSKEEKSAAEARQTKMLSWQIGAEASKMLAAEPQKWGAPSKSPAFPVWQDVKSFYDQYLDMKYANIKRYLRSVSPTDVLAVVVERLKGEKADVNDTLRRKKTAAVEEQLAQEMSTADREEQQAENEFDASYKSGLEALKSKRAAIVAEHDRASAKLKADSEELSDLRNQAQDDAGQTMRDAITAKESFPSSWSGSASGKTTITQPKKFDDMSDEFYSKAADNKANSGIDKLDKQVTAQKKEIAALDDKLAAVDAEIKAYRLKAQGKVSAAKTVVEKLKSSLQEKAADVIGNVDENYAKDVRNALISALKKTPLKHSGLAILPNMVAAQLEESATEALNNLYELVDRRVDQARAELAALKDNLYNPEYHRQVEQIHQRMITDIKALAISVSAAGIAPISGIQIYERLLTADTSAEEEDYFVGSSAKARDLKAPMIIFVENLPPLREMFHFDEVDFQNVKPFVDGNTQTSAIINSEFLNVGGEIPKVWQYMLRRHAYVEADMNLNEALSVGCSQVAFMRGGFMPCRVKDSALIVDMNAEGHYIRSNASGNLPECPYLEARSGGLYHTLREVNLSLGASFGGLYQTFRKAGLSSGASDEQPAADCSYSELGTLFEADSSNNLQFRQPTYNAYYEILKELNDGENDPSTDAKRRLAGFDRTPLALNQIGEFLTYAENERTMREQLEDLEEQYKAMMEELFKLLRSYGFDPSPNLNLADESDYNLVRNKLDNIKNQNISEALTKVSAIKTAGNEVVAERVETQQKVIAALQKDKNEMTIIGGAVEDKNNLDEEIKTSKVNEDVAGKFIDSLNKASAAVKLPDAPYCASY